MDGGVPELRVLIIDDNVDFATSMSYLLQMQEGCKTAVAFDGESGVRVAQLFQPALILLDFDLAGAKGSDVLQEIHNLPGTVSHAMSVCVTGNTDPETESRCLGAGFTRFLRKPISADSLAMILAEAHSRVQYEASAQGPPA